MDRRGDWEKSYPQFLRCSQIFQICFFKKCLNSNVASGILCSLRISHAAHLGKQMLQMEITDRIFIPELSKQKRKHRRLWKIPGAQHLSFHLFILNGRKLWVVHLLLSMMYSDICICSLHLLQKFKESIRS